MPRDHTDQYRYACLMFPGERTIPCSDLQQHANLISLVQANLDGHTMTQAQFERVLTNIDERMAAATYSVLTPSESQTLQAPTPSAPGAATTASPRWIAFYAETTTGTDVRLIHPDGTGLAQLAPTPGHNGQFAWSPDGKHLAFTSDCDGNNEIYEMDPTGLNVTRLTTDPASDNAPAWSLDVNNIAFASDRTGKSEIYVMGSDGSNVRQLTSDGSINQDPSWSPDGQHLAFATRRDGHYEIYTMNADGSRPQRVTQSPGLAASFNPKWSPDGKWIACQTVYALDDARISIIELSSGRIVRLTNFAGYSAEPSWAPDSREIAFSSTANGNTGIFVTNLDGSTLRQLTDNNTRHGSPAWSL